MIDERDLIRTNLDDTLIVEAAAGTGKTTQLVARIVLLIETGRARITEVVAVTFSEKAAGELKLRLREELEKARVSALSGSVEAGRLDAAVLEFEEAHVSTIHGFCAELLRERPVEARIDPSFEVLTEAASERLYNEAFSEWMEAALESPGEGVRRSLRRPRRMSWWQDTEEGDGPIERLRRAGRDLLQWRDHPASWKRPQWDREPTIDQVVQSVLDFAAMTASPIYERDSLYQDTASLRRSATEIARTTQQSPRDYDGLEALLTTLASDRNLASTRKGSGAMYAKTLSRDAVLQAREGLLSALKTFKTIADADLAGCVHAELQSCVRSFEQRKVRAGALDFLDLLILASNLVRDTATVRQAFQRRFKYILVDEFQDTDPLQAELLMLLAADEQSGGSRIRPGALFVVGDPKQSIYRFRRADIGMYQRICDELARQDARPVVLQQSFRSVRNIQRFVNAAFHGVMQRDDDSLQPGYVPLAKYRDDIPGQPSVVALPVPRPYGRYRIAKASIEKSLPDAIGEFVRWVVAASGWQVTVPGDRARPLRASDVCLLFRRFIAYQDDVTRTYVEALESRGVPHLLVGGKTFHEREEVDAIRTALCAIEWPEDELSVFAALHGPLFAIGDEELLEYHALMKDQSRAHAFHPYHVPDDLPEHLAAIGDSLRTLRELHAGRNYRPVADTIGRLMQITRAHASFMLWKSGEQVLANVLHIGELARQYESDGGLSFRGFVETLRDAGDRAQAPEAPILEEGSDGVRLMTVHKAKGLEFPVVILADIACGLSRDDAQRYLDTDRHLCAMKLAGWSPLDLIENNDREARRDAAEGMRLAYVAATRARDVLVVPAVGDGPLEDSWVRPLNQALYPPLAERQSPRAAAGVPRFRTRDTVLERPDGDMAGSGTMWPGEYSMVDSFSQESYSIVWWDPALVDQPGDDTRGLRRDDLISKEARLEDVAADRARYQKWQADRAAVHGQAAKPSLAVVTATEYVKGDAPAAPSADVGSTVTVVDASVPGPRPGGRRFGVLVHALLAAAPLDATRDTIDDLAVLHARMLGASDDERAAAAVMVERALAHDVLRRAHQAAAAGHSCRREVPISFMRDGVLIDGQIDLAFHTQEGWVVVDFKTDAELGAAEDVYRRQVALYAEALTSITQTPATATILRV
ncbi:MAG TPA: UvrD-helicase domain-containing protein [Vicinamibacterales bacterium]|nr:UvrD-helicase domain-containing protein [Vicinamibacterales bacterium]